MSPNITLADIDTRIRVFRDALPHAGFHAACKALARIAQFSDEPLTAIPAAEALARYDALVDVPESVRSDERIYLRRALGFPALPYDTSERIRRGEPTFADAITVVEAHATALEYGGKQKEADAWRNECGRIKGALYKLANTLRIQMGAAPAALIQVDAALAKVTHADFAYDGASGSFVSFCSRIRRAVRLVDILARRRLSASMLTGPWKSIVNEINQIRNDSCCRGHIAKLWPLVDYCYRHDIPPAKVDNGVIAALQADLDLRDRKGGFNVARNAIYAWEWLQKRLPAFPSQRLQRIYRDGPSPHSIPFEQLPEDFRANWQAYAVAYFRDAAAAPTSLESFVLDEDADLVGADPYASRHHPDAKKDFKTVLAYAANAAIDRGISLQTVRDVLTAPLMQAVLVRVAKRQKARAEGNGEEFSSRNNTLKNYATIFLSMARDLGADDASIGAMERLRDQIDPTLLKIQKRPDGRIKRIRATRLMGPRHAKRLRQFNEPVKMLAWHEMPPRLEARVRARLRTHRRLRLQDCNDLAVAVVYAISRSTAIRPKNYVKLRINGPRRNVFLPAHHRTSGYIHIDWTEVKNNIDLDLVLPPETVSLIELWRTHARPVVVAALGSAPENPYLFPANGMKSLSQGELNKDFVSRSHGTGGFVLNLHCQRHMAAKIVLDADPSRMGLVQILLGHKTIKTTQAYYAELNMLFAQRQFHDILAAHEAKLRALPLKKRAA